MKLLKVFEDGLVSPFRNMKFEVGKEYVCHDFDKNPIKDCSRGFYATDWDGLSYAYRKGRHVYWCEVAGEQVEIDPFKRRYEKITILEKLSLKQIKDGLTTASVCAGYDLYHVSFPVHPLKGDPKEPTEQVFKLVSEWSSIQDSIQDSVRPSVRSNVGFSVWASVWSSVEANVWNNVWFSVKASIWSSVWSSGFSVRSSVGSSIRAYISSLFPNIKKWNGFDQFVDNPFKPGIDLWVSGYIPVFLKDGSIKICSGGNAKIVWEGTKEELRCKF